MTRYVRAMGLQSFSPVMRSIQGLGLWWGIIPDLAENGFQLVSTDSKAAGGNTLRSWSLPDLLYWKEVTHILLTDQ